MMIHVENFSFPYAAFNFCFLGGSVLDPRGKAGLAHLAANMLSRGTQKHDRESLAGELDFLGTSLSISVGAEIAHVFMDCAKRNLPSLLELACEMLAQSTFPEGELDKLKRQTVAEIAEMKDNDAAAGQLFLAQLLFEGHPYGVPSRGFEKSVLGVTREDVVAFHTEALSRANLMVGSAGAFSAGEARANAETVAAALQQGTPRKPTPSIVPRGKGNRVLLVTHPERTQAQVMMGRLAVKASDPDYDPLRVAVTGFGGTFTSVLVREIREKRGWSYGVGASLNPGLHTGTFTVHFAPKNEDVVPAIELSLDLLSDFAHNGLAREHLDFSKQYLVNQFPFMFDTPVKKLELLTNVLLTGRPGDYIETYVQRTNAVGEEAAVRAVRRAIDPQGMSIVVVGDESLAPALRSLPAVESFRVVPHTWDGELPPV